MSKHRHSIISLHEAGERQCDISRALKIAKQTVSKTVQEGVANPPSVCLAYGKSLKREFYGIRRDQSERSLVTSA